MRIKLKLSWRIILCLLGFWLTTAWSLPSDTRQPLKIFAAGGHFDGRQGVSVLQGPVKLVQGTSVLTANQLIIYTDKKNRLIKMVAEGNPAHYHTEISVDRGNFEATAKQITYLPGQQRIILTGDAKATQGENSYAAPQIEYRIGQQAVISPPSAHGRTTIVILPQSLSGKSNRD